jgi:hypothetical protein
MKNQQHVQEGKQSVTSQNVHDALASASCSTITTTTKLKVIRKALRAIDENG